jgi:menaquinone reductase, multiheme cytochrome c subunit
MRSAAVFVAGLAGALAFGWLGFPHLLYVAADQPVQFSHAVHTSDAAGLSCADCHSFRVDGTFGGIPPVSACGDCHGETIGSSAEEKRLVEEYVKPGREIRWRVYARQPDNVFFPHAPHVKKAGIACETCHAGHGQSPSLVAFESDRVSGYARHLMMMSECEGCHRRRHQGTLACVGCHR